MSLTRIIENDKTVREEFSKYIRIPETPKSFETLVPRIIESTQVIAQAFDYLMRFHLERIHSKEMVHKISWIASKSYTLCVNQYLKDYSLAMDAEKIKKEKRTISFLNFQLIHCTHELNKFLKKRELTDDLLDRCLFLARLDELYRIKKFNKDINKRITEEEASELRNLYFVMIKIPLIAKKHVYLNPDFGMASTLAKGADADFILDDILVDIKVHSKISITKDLIYQLIGYVMLNHLGGINKTGRPIAINYIAAYFARHGAFIKYPIEEIISKENLEILTKWFSDYLRTGTQRQM